MSNWCRYCGDWIDWKVEANGRKVPVNADGGNHFATCRGWKKKMAAKSAKLKAERERDENRRQLRLF